MIALASRPHVFASPRRRTAQRRSRRRGRRPPRAASGRRLRHVRPDHPHRERQLRRGARRADRQRFSAAARASACRWRAVRRRRRVALQAGASACSCANGEASARHSGRDHDHAARSQRRMAFRRRDSRSSCRTWAAASPSYATRRPRLREPAEDVDERFNGYHLSAAPNTR